MRRTPIPVPNPHDVTGIGDGLLPRSLIDPEAGCNRGRKLLVVSSVEGAAEQISEHTSPVDTIKVVVPAVRQGFLDWLANDQKAFAHAENVAGETAEALPGHSVSSSAGEADIALAIRDALATFAADEIIVAIRNDDDAGFIESMATANAPRRSVEGVPVRCIVISGA